MKTHITKQSEIDRKWYLIDANEQTLGRLSSKVAVLLIGKHKASYATNLDVGDNVILINAKSIKLSGNKAEDKSYFHASSYPGNSKSLSFKQAFEKDPTYPLVHAVKGMLPKNSRGRQMIKKLFVYADENHPHSAQKPEPLEV